MKEDGDLIRILGKPRFPKLMHVIRLSTQLMALDTYDCKHSFFILLFLDSSYNMKQVSKTTELPCRHFGDHLFHLILSDLTT